MHAPESAHVEPSADVDARATIGARTKVWHRVHIREHSRVGSDCHIGGGAYLGPGVLVGDRCKIQNSALVYEPAVLEDGVFVGPAAVLTNDTFPRAVAPDGRLKTEADWTLVGVTIKEGASIGAAAVCVAPVTIGSWAMVAAGAVVTRDVPDFALVAGVPATQVGWVGRAGVPLHDDGADRFVCPMTGTRFRQSDGLLHEVSSMAVDSV